MEPSALGAIITRRWLNRRQTAAQAARTCWRAPPRRRTPPRAGLRRARARRRRARAAGRRRSGAAPHPRLAAAPARAARRASGPAPRTERGEGGCGGSRRAAMGAFPRNVNFSLESLEGPIVAEVDIPSQRRWPTSTTTHARGPTTRAVRTAREGAGQRGAARHQAENADRVLWADAAPPHFIHRQPAAGLKGLQWRCSRAAGRQGLSLALPYTAPPRSSQPGSGERGLVT